MKQECGQRPRRSARPHSRKQGLSCSGRWRLSCRRMWTRCISVRSRGWRTCRGCRVGAVVAGCKVVAKLKLIYLFIPLVVAALSDLCIFLAKLQARNRKNFLENASFPPHDEINQTRSQHHQGGSSVLSTTRRADEEKQKEPRSDDAISSNPPEYSSDTTATHLEQEAIADERSLLREAETAANPVDPTSRESTSLSSFSPRLSLDQVVHPKQSTELAGPDTTGGTHIPEAELPVKMHHRKENTAARPSDPNDPNSMDGRSNPTAAGDDMAI